MKTKFLILLFVIVCLNFISAQTQWTKYANNPVIKKQNFITEFYAIGQPTLLFENDTLKMWYVAAGLPYITSRLLYAWSLNGINWTKYNSGAAVMNPGTPGSWDVWIDTPEIFHDASGYKLYYYGDTVAAEGAMPSSLAGIGVATSPDGKIWTKYGNSPVLTHGNPGEWDQHWIESPAVLYDSIDGKYLMWFSGVDTSSWRIQIGLATSPDGFIWTKYAGNPVLSVGMSGSHDDMWVSVPGVIKKGNEYEMLYSTFSSVTGWNTIYIGYATSPDGINWIKHPNNPLLSTQTLPYDSAVDKGGPWAPDFVFDTDSNQYYMWYETSAGFCLASSVSNTGIAVQNDFLEGGISIYPNPTNGDLGITITPGTREEFSNAELKIYDVLGQEVYKLEIKNPQSQIYFDLPDGIYFFKIISKNFLFTQKIIQQ